MILDRIVEDTRRYVEAAKERRPIEELRADTGVERRSLVESITESTRLGRPAIIAEIKRRSPSGGEMGHGFGLTELASIYEQSGAVGISVLTDEKHFGGSIDDLLAVKRATALPILRKDFIIDEYQVYEAKAYGADVILLIAAILDDGQIARFITLAHELGLEVLLESHTEGELRRSIATDAGVLGINNRNLDTLKTDILTSVDLLSIVPDDRIAISESGISAPEHIRLLLGAGADGFLIGESLLKSGNPGQKLAELIQTSLPL